MPNGDPRDCITYSYSTSSNSAGNWNVYPGDVYIGDPIPGQWDWPSTTPYVQPQPYVYPNPTIQLPPYPWTVELNPIESEKQRAEIATQIEKILSEHLKTPKLKEGLMKVFEVLVIDKRECKVLDQKVIVAQDRETAMLDLDLAPETREKIKRSEVEFIFAEKGSFTKVERKVRISELKEED
jgi:hypothetical protein